MAQDGTAGGVNVSGSQGVQIGDGGTLINNWVAKPQLDLAFLRALNTHAAVARIRLMPHDDAVNLFATSLLGDVDELFRAVLAADDALMVSILGEIHLDRAWQMLDTLPRKSVPWQNSLPIAADRIALRAAQVGWGRDGNMGRLQRDNAMFFRNYEEGSIYWDAERGAHPISRAFMECYRSDDLGYPMDDDNNGAFQSFQNGFITANGYGIFSVSGVIYRKFGLVDPGEPVATREDFEGYSRQHFEGGTVYESKHGIFFVRSDLAELETGIPLEDEVEATSPYETTGVAQRFCRKLRISGDWEVMVCSSDEYGTFDLADHRLRCYQALGGPESWLGFPIAQQERVREQAWLQRFEGGILYYPHYGHPAVVKKETLDLIGEPDGGTKLGWPVSEEQAIGAGADRIQFFENGAFVLRDGKREILMRPEPAVETVPEDVTAPEAEAAGRANPHEAGVTVPGWKSFPR
jgi:hypothetical protein